MDTEFAFLKELERDLLDSARVEKRRLIETAKPRRASHKRAWLGAAASFLAIAFVIGAIAQNGGLGGGSQASSAAGQFSTVGSAVGGAEKVPGLQGGEPNVRGEPNVLGVGGIDYSTPSPAASTAGKASTDDGSDLSKIIRDGAIALTIGDGSFTESQRRVFAIAAANRGSVLSSSTSGGDSGAYTLRIPADNFNKAMVQLGDLGTVDSSEIHGQDVTAEFIDTKAHLKIYLTHRTFLYGLMAKATTTGEALSLENQLQQTQLKIDQVTGQLRYLNNQVAESTIKVDLHEPDAVTATTDDIRKPSLGRAVERAVQGFLNVLGAVVIGLGYLIPLGVIAGVVWLGVWVVRRRSRRTTGDG